MAGQPTAPRPRPWSAASPFLAVFGATLIVAANGHLPDVYLRLIGCIVVLTLGRVVVDCVRHASPGWAISTAVIAIVWNPLTVVAVATNARVLAVPCVVVLVVYALWHEWRRRSPS